MTQSSASIGARFQPQTPAGPLWAGVLSAVLLTALEGPALLRPLAVVAALPLMLQRLRGGVLPTSLGALLALALLALVFPGWSAVTALALLLPGLLMAESVARGRGLLRGCGWALTLTTLCVGAALLVLGERMELLLQELLRLTPDALQQLRAEGAGQLDELLALRQALSVVYPGVWFVLGGLQVVINAVLLRGWLLRNDPGWLESGEFESLRWPVALTVPFVLSGLGLMFDASRRTGLNGLVVLAFFFALQGLAIVAYYLQRLAGPPLLRAGLAALVLLNPWATHVLVLLGLFDNWADFRRWADPPAEED